MSTFRKLSKYCFVTLIPMLVIAFLGITAFANVVQAQVAQVYIEDLTLDYSDFTAGETVSGSFVMKNGSSEPITNVNYHVFLVGGLQANTLYKYEFDSQVSEPMYLNANEAKLVSFEYQLPLVSGAYSIGEQLGIKVKAYSGAGEPFGWDDVTITVTDSGISFVEVSDVEVVVGEESFIANEGPTVNEGETAILKFNVKNGSDAEVSNLTPQISIYEMDYVKDPLSNYSEDTFSIAAGTTQSLELELPTFEYTPKVYAGELVLVDSEGLERSSPLKFRYIVGGDIVNIRNVMLSQSAAEEGESIDISVEYSGIPGDITSDAKERSNETEGLNFELKLFNEKNELVAEYNDTDSFSEIGNKNITVELSGDAQAFGVQILITKDGKVISEYDTVIANADGVDIGSDRESSIFSNIYVLITLLIILIAALFFVRSKTKKDVLLVLMIFIGTAFVVNNIDAFTQITSYQWDSNSTNTAANITLSINSPQDGGTYEPGDTFIVSGTSYSYLCNNSTTDTNIFSSPITQDTSWPYTGSTGQQDYDPTSGMTQIGDNTTAHNECGGSSWCTKDFEFASASYTVPYEEGTYRIYVYGQTIQNAHNETAFTASYRMGYIEFDVVCSSGNCEDPGEGGEGGEGDQSNDPNGVCLDPTGPFSTFPSQHSLVCESGAPQEGAHTEDEWRYICVGTSTSSGQCSADKIEEEGGGSGSLDIIDEDVDPKSELDSELDTVAITSDDKCVIRWDLNTATSTGQCVIVGEDAGQVQSTSYPAGSYSEEVKASDKYTITCTDSIDSNITDTSAALSCITNPSIIEQ